MSDLQALLTGWLAGVLARAPESGLLVDVEPVLDAAGSYRPELLVRGRQSGECVRIRVEAE